MIFDTFIFVLLFITILYNNLFFKSLIFNTLNDEKSKNYKDL